MIRMRKWFVSLLLMIIMILGLHPQTAFAASVAETCEDEHSFNQDIVSIAHRGYSQTAPENTLIAYRLAKEKGFTYVECDISFTADGVAVLLHDTTIDRTSDGSGNISEITYDELLQYDFGSWKNTDYTGTKIPTFEEFIALCAELELHPYIELKRNDAYSQDKVQQLTELVHAYGIGEYATWISSSRTLLHYVKNADPSARLGYISSSDATESVIFMAKSLQTDSNEVFLNLPYQELTDTGILHSAAGGLSIEVYTVNSENAMLALPAYVSGVTSDFLHAQMLINGTETDYTCNICGAQQHISN